MSETKWPAVCRQCMKKFDLGSVTVTSHYADCDVFKAPCCGAVCDTRTLWSSPSWGKHGYDDLNEFRLVEGQSYDGPIVGKDGIARVRGRALRQ